MDSASHLHSAVLHTVFSGAGTPNRRCALLGRAIFGMCGCRRPHGAVQAPATTTKILLLHSRKPQYLAAWPLVSKVYARVQAECRTAGPWPSNNVCASQDNAQEPDRPSCPRNFDVRLTPSHVSHCSSAGVNTLCRPSALDQKQSDESNVC